MENKIIGYQGFVIPDLSKEDMYHKDFGGGNSKCLESNPIDIESLELRPVCSSDISPIENSWSKLAQQLAQDTPLAATPDQFWQ
ncbi:hypothetical protein TNCV_1073691 [Trichonephila clavipes]|uniref:Uncharacterized protein n=1 Tax=Trichonephila clavipes TaxID=2585209 RepID=A0A8X6VQP2_TRICX|nr:hypothetical protein TNCV_1073691 [Trichonephila clavipes]